MLKHTHDGKYMYLHPTTHPNVCVHSLFLYAAVSIPSKIIACENAMVNKHAVQQLPEINERAIDKYKHLLISIERN